MTRRNRKPKQHRSDSETNSVTTKRKCDNWEKIVFYTRTFFTEIKTRNTPIWTYSVDTICQL